MHRKTSTAAERLAALRALIVTIARHTGVAVLQVLAATLAYLRTIRPGDVRAAVLACVRTSRALRAGDVRYAVGSLLRSRHVVASVGYLSLLIFAIVGGAVALVRGGSEAPPIVALAGAQDRLAAAERADRSSRADAATPGDASPAAAAAAAPAVVGAPPAWVIPMPGAAVSSCYGPRWGTLHQGMDFAAPPGTPILAAGGGTVFGAGWLYSGYGISVVIDHGDGYFTHYAHASGINVAVGQRVSAGQIIAWEGSTGDSTGPHLHFEVHEGLWHQVNPAQFLRQRGVSIGC